MSGRLTTTLVLAVLVLLGLNLKLRMSTDNPRYDSEDETGYFRAESAYQYRYARLTAEGRPLPEVDKSAQWPEGVNTRRDLTSTMERLTGWTYRLFAPDGLEFRWFVLLWVALISSLSIVAFYACAESLTRSPPLALAGAAAYGLSWAAQGDVIASYRLETLGMPLLFGALACGALALDERSRRPRAWAAACAALVLAAFSCWHFTRFVLATYLAAAAFAFWRLRDRKLGLFAAGVAAGTALAFLLLPSARATSYGHVYGLVWAKLAHGLRHPADPAALSPIQRLEWTGPSDSPDLGFAVFAFIPLGLLALTRLTGKAARSTVGSLYDGLALIYLGGTILSSRLAPWLAFFLVLSSLRRPKLWALVAVAVLEAAKCAAPISPLNPFLALSAPFASNELRPAVSLTSERELLGWLRRYGGPDRPTLAPMGLSAEILAYSGTPVLLQPKWEAAAIREKTAEFAQALFEDEDAFTAYMKKYQAKLFVYGADAILDETPEGLRYASGRMPVDENSAAYLFQFAPKKLKNFSLVFQNEDYRVYALGKYPADFPSLAVFDRSQYGPDLDCKSVLRRMESSRGKLVLARVLAQMGRGEEALSTYDEAFALWPPDPALKKEYDALKNELAARRLP